MAKDFILIQIGSMVTIDLGRVGDRIPSNLRNLLIKDSKGLVLSYKITDGGGIGVVLKLSDNSVNWFFEEELKDVGKESLFYIKADLESAESNQFLPDSQSIERKVYSRSKNLRLSITPSISDVLNPFNFIKWLIYSLKDVF